MTNHQPLTINHEPSTMKSPRDLVLSVLAGEKPDRVPFIIWNNKLPPPDCDLPLAEGVAARRVTHVTE